MVSGKRAFRGKSAVETMNSILTEEPPCLADTEQPIPPALEQIIAHCLEKDPTDRFQSAQDLAFDLELVSKLSYFSAPAPEQTLASWASNRRAIVAAFILVLGALVAGVIVGWIFWRAEPSSTSPVRVHRLTEFAGLEEFPALSHDGRSVAFTADVEGKRQLWVRLIGGGPALQITHDRTDHLCPRW